MSCKHVAWVIGLVCVGSVFGAESKPEDSKPATSPPTPGIMTHKVVRGFSGSIAEVNHFTGTAKVKFNDNVQPPVGTLMHAYHKSLLGAESVGHLEILRYEKGLAIVRDAKGEAVAKSRGDLVDGGFEEVVSIPTPLTQIASKGTTNSSESKPKPAATTSANPKAEEMVNLPLRGETGKSKRLIEPPTPAKFATHTTIENVSNNASGLFSPPWEKSQSTQTPAVAAATSAANKPEAKRVKLSIGDTAKMAEGTAEQSPEGKRIIPVDPHFVDPPLPVVDPEVLRSYR